MKGQNDGVENEKQIVDAINEKRIKMLSEYQKKFIRQLDESADEETIVHATKVGGQGYKPDVQIRVGDTIFNVSVKKGGGNSVHQEKTDYFIHYCMKYLDMTEEERDSLLMFLYGDGTLDGDSQPEERLSDQELTDTYKEQIGIVQNFLDKNKRNLLERFLVYGRLGKENNIKADYIYHGDAQTGVWCPLDFDAIDFLTEQPNAKDAPLSIGPLTLQVWNRNLEGKPEMENRRHSIQVKWGACKSYVEKINQLHLEKEANKEKEVGNKRIQGDNRQGFENQEKLIAIIDGSRVSDLPLAVKNIVLAMFPNVALSETVRAMKLSTSDTKPRMAIAVNGEVKNLSVFMGSGNSVHQENLKNFITYCKNELGMTDDEEHSLLKIMYGDGTVDGKSEVADRLKNTEEVKQKYANDVKSAQEFFNKHKRDLAERFLVYGKGGKTKNVKSDFIYYGTDVTGKILPYPVVIEYIVEQKGSESALLSVGSLTSQPWNRNPEGKANLEDRRHSIQIKWGGMKQNIAEIALRLMEGNVGTADGDWEEYELVSKLNRDKKVGNKLWNILCETLDMENLDDVYAVRVSNTVYSKLSERMVLPKADVYLVKGKIAHQVLLDNNYWLDEDAISGLDVKFIENSGVSCKRPNSSSFTYAKFTIKSFVSLFGSRELGAGISIFVKESELAHNENVLSSWDTTEEDMMAYYANELDKAGIDVSDRTIMNIEVAKVIKNSAIVKAGEMINTNKNISNAIFFGIGVFDEPYTAHFTYIGGKLGRTYIPKFSITTGSGRHKGNFTIIVKP